MLTAAGHGPQNVEWQIDEDEDAVDKEEISVNQVWNVDVSTFEVPEDEAEGRKVGDERQDKNGGQRHDVDRVGQLPLFLSTCHL